MNLQYITDSNGQTTGVFIPINEWNDLKTKFKDIDHEGLEVPEWHKEIVRKRMELYKNNPDQSLDFDSALDDIEKGNVLIYSWWICGFQLLN
jgi:hypothetical protein